MIPESVFDYRTADALFFDQSLTRKSQRLVDQELVAVTYHEKTSCVLKAGSSTL